MSTATTTLRAFHNDKAVKAKYLKRVNAHARADAIVQSYGYWNDGKGCAVGCTLHSSNHSAYETELGIPTALAWLEDTVFENLPNALAKTWPARFLKAVPVGADLSLVVSRFLYWLMNRNLQTVGKNSPVAPCIIAVRDLYGERLAGKEPAFSAWRAAAAAADAAADADADAAWRAAAAAADAAAAAWRAADADAAAAAWRAADADADAARKAFFTECADKLLELLKGAK
jgi:hypothetical protein